MPKLFYIISMFIRKRVCLKQVFNNPNGLLEKVENLTSEYLHRSHIKLLALDFDGVMSHHGSVQPSESVIAWLRQMNTDFQLRNVCIYSNNLFPERVQYMKRHFPNIPILFFTKKKPYPNDLLEFAQSRQLHPQEILIVDDRLTSGILSACIMGAKSLLIKRPVIDYRASTVKEYFYTAIRYMERLMLRF